MARIRFPALDLNELFDPPDGNGALSPLVAAPPIEPAIQFYADAPDAWHTLQDLALVCMNRSEECLSQALGQLSQQEAVSTFWSTTGHVLAQISAAEVSWQVAAFESLCGHLGNRPLLDGLESVLGSLLRPTLAKGPSGMWSRGMASISGAVLANHDGLPPQVPGGGLPLPGRIGVTAVVNPNERRLFVIASGQLHDGLRSLVRGHLSGDPAPSPNVIPIPSIGQSNDPNHFAGRMTNLVRSLAGGLVGSVYADRNRRPDAMGDFQPGYPGARGGRVTVSNNQTPSVLCGTERDAAVLASNEQSREREAQRKDAEVTRLRAESAAAFTRGALMPMGSQERADAYTHSTIAAQQSFEREREAERLRQQAAADRKCREEHERNVREHRDRDPGGANNGGGGGGGGGGGVVGAGGGGGGHEKLSDKGCIPPSNDFGDEGNENPPAPAATRTLLASSSFGVPQADANGQFSINDAPRFHPQGGAQSLGYLARDLDTRMSFASWRARIGPGPGGLPHLGGPAVDPMNPIQ